VRDHARNAKVHQDQAVPMDGYAVFAQHFGLVIRHASRPPRPYCRDAEPHCVGTGAGAFVTTISPLDTAQFLARTALPTT
jgi:hypothetical protein